MYRRTTYYVIQEFWYVYRCMECNVHTGGCTPGLTLVRCHMIGVRSSNKEMLATVNNYNIQYVSM